MYLCYTVAAGTERTELYKTLGIFFSCLTANIPEIQKKGQNYTTAEHVEHIFTQIYLDATSAFHIHPIRARFMPQPLQVKIKQAPLKLQQKQNL